MADSISIEVDGALDVERNLNGLGEVAQPFINDASRVTAEAVVREARSRLERQIGHSASTDKRPDLGQNLTLQGLTSRPAYDGNGYVVVDEREPFPNVPLWLEKGTKAGKRKNDATTPALHFFYSSGQLEVQAHIRRLEDAFTKAIAASGLGR